MAIACSLDWSIPSIHSTTKRSSNVQPFCPPRKALLPCAQPPSIPHANLHSQTRTPFYPASPAQDAHHLNKVLCGLLQDPQKEGQAYGYYERAKQVDRFQPTKLTLKLLVRYLIRSKKWGLISSLSDDFSKYNLLPDGRTCARLVSSCINARKFKTAESLLEIVKIGHSEKVAALIFDSAMRGYNKLHMYSRTILLYEKMKLEGTKIDIPVIYCQIMKAYQKIGETEKVVALFQECERREVESKPILTQVYRIFCESLTKSGRAFEALASFRGMQKKGIMGDSPIYSCLICSFAHIREVDMAEELFKEAEHMKLLKDSEIFLKLVLMYIDKGLLDKTIDVVKAMKRAQLTMSDCIFCTIVNGFSKRRGYRAAIKVYETLKSEGCEEGQVTYASIINAYCRAGLYSEAEMVFFEMEKKGFDKCVVAYSSMITMYGRTGRLSEATRLVAKMKLKGCEPNVWIYNCLLDMYGKAKDLRKVEKVWKEMKRRKVAPDEVSYTSVIGAYNRGREYDTCVRFYNEFRANGGTINPAMAGIMVGVFSKIDGVDELLKLLRDMKSEGTALDGRLYGSALKALRDSGLNMQAKWLQESFEAKKI